MSPPLRGLAAVFSQDLYDILDVSEPNVVGYGDDLVALEVGASNKLDG